MTRGIGIGMLLAMLPLEHLAAQQQHTVSARVLVERVFNAHTPSDRGIAFSELVGVMQQKKLDVARPTLDSIGDALVGVAMRARANVEDTKASADAMALLQMGAAPGARKPYAGSFSRLRYVVEHAEEVGVRGSALGAIARLGDRGQALEYLTGVVESQKAPFFLVQESIRHLSEMGEDGRKRLDEIDSRGTIKDSELRGYVRLILSRKSPNKS
ncbi:MAG: hypothetical protein ACRENP_22500 [Longimicrobiales bacterium]